MNSSSDTVVSRLRQRAIEKGALVNNDPATLAVLLETRAADRIEQLERELQEARARITELEWRLAHVPHEPLIAPSGKDSA